MLSEFEDVLNSFLHIKNVDVYVTGSNAKFLSKDIMTEFRGRGDQIHLYPLSFAKFMSGFGGDKQEGWQRYLMYGGLPMLLNLENDQDKAEYLKHIFEETYILKFKPDAKILYSTDERVEILQGLRVVDEVVVYDTVGIEALGKIDFDILALGEDHKGERFDTITKWCNEHGKKVVRLKRTPGICSSEIKHELEPRISPPPLSC